MLSLRTVLVAAATIVSLFAKTPQSFSLDGEWRYSVQHMPETAQYRYTFSGNEPSMIIPSNWYRNGINHAGVVWFEKRFDASVLKEGLHHALTFDGVDYIADVWFNGRHLGAHTGYFQPFDFDITPYVHPGENVVTVRVNSPMETYPEHYSLHKTLLRGVFSHHDTRPGGAWLPEGQDHNSGGIWNSVSIVSYADYRIRKLKATPHFSNDHVQIELTFDLDTLHKQQRSQLLSIFGSKTLPETSDVQKVHITLTPANFKGESFDFTADSRPGKAQRFSFDVSNAKRWNTHDRGFPYLYTLKVEIAKSTFEQRIGIREVHQARDGRFYLNGQPLYLKGTNYISSQYMSEMDNSAYRTDLDMMKKAHINTIRVHAHVEPQRFYDRCDEEGFLVWQDYNLQWGYLDTPEFTHTAIKQAKEMVDMLYNHPSVFLWCLHNEPPWDSSWMRWKYPDYNPNQNRTLDDQLYSAVKAYDSFHMTKKISSNIEHPWFGWYSGKYTDFAKPSKANVITEYGAQALPDLPQLNRIVSSDYLKPKTEKAKKRWTYHNFQFDWNEKNGIKYTGNIEAFIHNSQIYQADLITFAAEHLRMQKYHGTTAIFQFMFNEGWPSMSWGVVDYWRNPKPGYFALMHAYAPILPMANVADGVAQTYVVNDTLDTFEHATLTSARYANGTLIDTRSVTLTLTPDALLKTGQITLDNADLLELNLSVDGAMYTNRYVLPAQKELP